MSKRARIKVWKTTGAIFGEFFGHLGRWLAAAWLPFLLGTIVYIALAQFYWRNLQIESPPRWLLSIVLAPFTAMIFVRILKSIQLHVSVGFRAIELSRQMWLATPVIAVISLLFWGVDSLRGRIFEHQATTTDFVNIILVAAAGWSASWTLKAIIIVVSHGFFAIIVERNRIDVGGVFNLVRGHFWPLFALALLLGAIFVGFSDLYYRLVQFLELMPQGSALAPILSEATIFSFLSSLLWFPVHFLEDVLPAVSIGVVYLALRQLQSAQEQPPRRGNSSD